MPSVPFRRIALPLAAVLSLGASQAWADPQQATTPAQKTRTLPAEGTALSPDKAGDLAAPAVTPMGGVANPAGLGVPAMPKALLTPSATPAVTPAADPAEASPAPVTGVRPRTPITVAPGGHPAPGKTYAVTFAAGSAAADQVDAGLLRAIATRLAGDPAQRLEIRAYAPLPGPEREAAARHQSLLRAIAVRQRLLDQGVPRERIVVYAMGATPTTNPDHADLTFIP